jgi:VanZ like family
MRISLFGRRTQEALRIAAGCSWITLAMLSLVPGRDRPHLGISANFEHLLAYALAGFVTRLVLRRTASRWQFLAFSGAAAFFEVCQIWIPGRAAGFDNWAASSVGALIGIVLARRRAHPRGRKRQRSRTSGVIFLDHREGPGVKLSSKPKIEGPTP